MQGFFNFIIFICPRYRSNRRVFSQRRRWWALYQAVWNPLRPVIRCTTSGSVDSSALGARTSSTRDENIRTPQPETFKDENGSCREQPGNDSQNDGQRATGTMDDCSCYSSQDGSCGQEMPLASPLPKHMSVAGPLNVEQPLNMDSSERGEN
jgi:hypothetical protein